MAVRPIDANELLGIERLLDTDVVRQSKTASWLLDQVLHDIQAMPTLTPPNEPLTQADLDSMDYDKVWIDYEDGTGEWALVCDGVIYSIDTLEGAGLDFGEYMQGEMLEPHGYKVYRRPPEGEA